MMISVAGYLNSSYSESQVLCMTPYYTKFSRHQNINMIDVARKESGLVAEEMFTELRHGDFADFLSKLF